MSKSGKNICGYDKWKTKEWSLKLHRDIAILAGELLGSSLGVGLLANYWYPWFRATGEKEETFFKDKPRPGYFNVDDESIHCSIDYCFYAVAEDSNVEHSRIGVFLGWAVLNTGLGISALSFGLLFTFIVIAFFIKVSPRFIYICLSLSLYLSFIGAYTRFIGIFIVVNHMRTVNHNVMIAPKRHAVQIETLPVGVWFISFFLEVLAIGSLKVANDGGALGGETHQERLKREAGDRESQMSEGSAPAEKEQYHSERRRSSYIPQSMREQRESVLNNVRNWQISNDHGVDTGTVQESTATMA